MASHSPSLSYAFSFHSKASESFGEQVPASKSFEGLYSCFFHLRSKVCLFIDTAQKLTRIALFRDTKLTKAVSWKGRFHEFDTLLPRISKMLRSCRMHVSDIGSVVACVGPGGFTSVRLGVSTANALSFALQVPVGGVSIFDLLYEIHSAKKDFYVLLQANSDEVFVQGFGKCAHSFPEPQLVSWDRFFSSVGTGFSVVGEFDASFLYTLAKKYSKTLGFLRGRKIRSLPWEKISLSSKQIAPWYYKDVNITPKKDI